MTQFKLFLFGAPRLERDGQHVGIGLRKALALFAYLAVTRQPHSRDTLAALFWPETDQRGARASLRRTLYQLSQTLEEDLLSVTAEMVEIGAGADLWLDVALFRQHVDACLPATAPVAGLHASCLARLEEAIALYSNDFLPDFSLPDCTEFDDWQFFQREDLRQMATRTLEQLVVVYQAQGHYESAIDHARRWLSLDPLHEPVHRWLMRLYAWSGQQAAALRQYQECVRSLNEELGVPPEAETVDLYEAIRSRRLGAGERRGQEAREQGDAGAQAQIAFSAAPTHHLPTDPTPFVGRAPELAQLQHFLADPDCRLITIAGLGGMGKTRLALEAAQQLLKRDSHPFVDGALFIPLLGVDVDGASGGDAVLFALADALALPLSGSATPHQQVLDFLHNRKMLLILDNLEHLIHSPQTQMPAVTDLINEILKAAPDVKLLATSREPLHMQSEWRLDLGSLPYPEGDPADGEDGQPVDLEALQRYPAVQLFVQTAQQVRPAFELATSDLPHIRRLCQLLSGIPLALKLAGAWMRVLSCERIVHEVERSLDLLANQMRDVPARQRSIHAVFDYTWQLLDAEERRVFQAISVFRGGFTEEAAVQVATATPILLACLLDRDLLQVDRDARGVRYRLHELVRQYATEKIRALPDQYKALQDRHCAYYAAFLQAHETDLRGEQAQIALQLIGAEIENVRAGWHWLLDRLLIEPARQRLVEPYLNALFHFYDTRSRFQEGEHVFAAAAAQLAALESDGEGATSVSIVLGQIWGRQGWFAFHLGQHAEAVRLLQRSADLLSGMQDRATAIFSLNYLGAVHRHLGSYEQAERSLNESLALCRETDDRFGASIALNILGQIAYLQGAYARAEQLCQEGLAIKRQIGDRWGTVFSLNYLGAVAQAQHRYEAAQQLFEESRSICEALGDRRGVANATLSLGDIALLRGQHDSAQRMYRRGLAIFEAIDNVIGIVVTHTRLADLAREQADHRMAWRSLRQALRMAADLQVTPQILDALTSAAALWIAQGEIARGEEILKCTLAHPASSVQNRQRANTLLAEQAHPPAASAPLGRAEADAIVKRLIDETLLNILPDTRLRYQEVTG